MQSTLLVGEVGGSRRPPSVLNQTVQCMPTSGPRFRTQTFGTLTGAKQYFLFLGSLVRFVLRLLSCFIECEVKGLSRIDSRK
jgi:hypothetical protein